MAIDSVVNKIVQNYWLKKITDFESEVMTFSDKGEDELILRSVKIPVTAKISNRISSIGNSNQQVIGSVYLSFFAILLCRYYDRSSVLIGFPGQLNARLFFSLNLGDEDSLKDVIKKGGKEINECLNHFEYDYNELTELLPKGHAYEKLLSQFGFNYLGLENPNLLHSKFQLELNIQSNKKGETELEISYNENIFSEEFIKRFGNHYITLLSSVNTDLEIKVKDVKIISKEEEKQLLNAGSFAKVKYPAKRNIIDFFEERVKDAPSAIALVFGEKKMTYNELNEKANQIAGHLKEKYKTKPGDKIALFLDRSEWMIASFLGILKAGAAYVPMDPDFPQERIDFMFRDASVKAIIADTVGLSLKDVDRQNIVALDKDWEVISSFSKKNPKNINDPDDLAYIIYTSGSTGQPKGVLVEHGNVVRLLFNEKFQFRFTNKDVWTLFHAVYFDFSVWEIFGALLYGGKLIVVPKSVAQDPKSFVQLIRKEKVTVLNQIPSIFGHVAAEILSGKSDDGICLKYVIFGGEALNPQMLKEWFLKYRNVKLINMYGITETTVHVTYKEIGSAEIEAGLSNIGKPIPTLSVYIMDKHHQLMPEGMVGEIVVGGKGVARGYLNRDELTKERFIVNPYNKKERLYCSGDLGMYLSNGELVYKGRKDQQVKIRGHRIELGEIENTLIKHDLIENAVVVVNAKNEDEKDLVAYVIAKTGGTEKHSLAPLFREYLLGLLPEYMVPAYFVCMDSFPVSATGKINRKELPPPEQFIDQISIEYVAPRTELEANLAKIWEEVLGIQKISVKDNYFAMGGDSIKAIRLIPKINENLFTSIRIVDLYQNHSIEDLAQCILSSKHNKSIHTELSKGLEIISVFKKMILASEESAQLPENFEDIYPISPIESGMIYSSLLMKETPVYYDQFFHQLEIKDIVAFKAALALLVKRHDMMRTRYYINRFKDPVKVVMKEVEQLPFEMEDLRGYSTEEQKEIVGKFLPEDLSIRLDFDGELLWRTKIFRITDHKYMVVWSFHHALLDGWSLSQLKIELSYLVYNNLNLAAIPEMKHTYKDYCAIVLGRQTMDDTYEYWRNIFKDYTRNKLPFNYSGKQKGQIGVIKTIYQELDDSLFEKLENIASKNAGVTVRSICVSAHIYLLHMLSTETDVITGVVSHDRPEIEDGDKLVGCFINTSPIRINIHEVTDNLSLIKKVSEFLIESKSKELHLSEVAKAIGERITSAGNPIYDTIFNFTDFHIMKDWTDSSDFTADHSWWGEEFEHPGTEMTNALFEMQVDTGRILARLKYYPAYFEAADMQYALELYVRILQRFAEDIHGKLDASTLLTESEVNEQVYAFNDTILPYSKTKTLHGIFEEQVMKTPSNVALLQQGRQLSYAELNERANKLARYLLDNGVKNGDNVGLITERRFGMIIGMFGILKVGAAYVPIDPEYPSDRQQYIIANSGVTCLLVDADYPVASNLASDIKIISLDNPEISRYNSENLNQFKESSELAYTIYTSGSTGRPKGVMIEHHSAVNLVEWVNKQFNVNDKDRLLFITSMCFDLSVYDIFGMLASGGSLVIASSDEIHDVVKLRNLLKSARITFWDSVPTTMNYLVNELEETDYMQEDLRLVFMSGDWIPVQLPDKIKKYFPSTEVISLGGATEGTVWSNFFPVKTVSKEWISVPYGKPITNNFFYILDDNLKPVPRGVAGELYIGGVGVARGYANDEGKTTASFKKDPFCETLGGRMYKTGDLGRMHADWNMEFIGRKDHQVKIRGYRVELGEIESQLLKYPLVREAIVETWKDSANVNYLCAYIVSSEEIGSQLLREHLQKELPTYMIPSHFIWLDKMPLTSNGKINRKALPEPKESALALTEYKAPFTMLEKKLAEMWKVILKIEKIGVNDNFFELGAHSLHIAPFINKLHKELDVQLNIRDIFNNSTIAELSLLLSKKESVTYENLEPVPVQEYYELSHGQRRFWILEQISNDIDGINNMPFAIELKGNFNKDIFFKAYEAIIKRHESLRTTIQLVNGEPKQKINQYQPLKNGWQFVDLRRISDKNERVKEIALMEAGQAFNLVEGPLLKTKLLQTEDDAFVLFYTMHHIISDKWSQEVLNYEILKLYNAYSKGEEFTLKPLKIQYKDFAAWQNKLYNSQVFSAHKEYWMNQFKNSIPVLELPKDFARPAHQTFNGKTVKYELPSNLSINLRKLSQKHGTSLFMTLLASVKALLARYSGQTDFIIGTTHAGRNHSELENQIGFYVNTLPLRTRIESADTFIELLSKVKETTLSAFEHQDYPFNRIIDDLNLERDMSRSPLFDVLVELHNVDIEGERNLKMDDVSITDYKVDFSTSKFDLTFHFTEEQQDIQVFLEYNTDLFKQERIERMLEHFSNLLAAIIKNENVLVAEVDFISDAEMKSIISDFNKTGASFSDTTIHELFEKHAQKTPDACAVEFNGNEFTYAFINKQADLLADHLIENYDIKPGATVGVLLNRSEKLIIAMLGVLKAGAAYVPIDPLIPDERKEYILSISDPLALLTEADLMFSVGNYKGPLFAMDLQLDDLKIVRSKEARSVKPADLAYVLYTSGSTGVPKGCEIEHGNLVNYISWADKYYFGKSDAGNFGLFTSVSFDLTITSIFCPLTRGKKLYIYPQHEPVSSILEHTFDSNNSIDSIKLTPSHISLIENLNITSTNIKKVIVGGEELKHKHVNILLAIDNRIEIVNEYGPTETTVGCTATTIQKTDQTLLIGKPISNTQVYILDKNRKIQPIGIEGEIFIGGKGVGRGYLKQTDLTNEKFIDNPYVSNGKLYCTGDVGRWHEDGNIEFLGRIDDQVKIRGYRIELSEIEKNILDYPSIGSVVVIARNHDDNMELVAYIVSDEKISSQEIRSFLGNRLPAYMIPDFFVKVNAFSLTENGKINKALLPAIESLDVLKETEYAAPVNELEMELLELWSEVLGIETAKIGTKDNFFDLGGNSLKIIKMVWLVNQKISKKISVVNAFNFPNIQALSQFISSGEKAGKQEFEQEMNESANIMEQTFNLLNNDKNGE